MAVWESGAARLTSGSTDVFHSRLLRPDLFHVSLILNLLKERLMKSHIFSVGIRKMKSAVITSCLLFLPNCAERVSPPAHMQATQPQASGGEKGAGVRKSWEPIFFEEISERIEGTDIKNLRDEALPSASREVRVWVGFNLSPLRGILLKQTSGVWSARYVPPAGGSAKTPRAARPLSSPRSGWNALWEKLESLGIYTLPDAVDIGVNNPYPEATCVVIEVKTSDSYRTYKYSGLYPAEAPEVKNVVEIINTLSDEFGVQLEGV